MIQRYMHRYVLFIAVTIFSTFFATNSIFAAEPILAAPTLTNLAAGSATLAMQSDTTGTGYFTVLLGSNVACGTGAQVQAGQDSLSAAAYRFGSLSLTTNIPSYYTARNLTASTSFTVCFTADDGVSLQQTPISVNMDTVAVTSPTKPAWNPAGSTGFSAGPAYFTSLAFAPDGTPFVAYRDNYNGYSTTVMKYSDGAWIVVGSAGFSAGQADYLSLTFAPDGTPHVAYRDYYNSNKATVMKFSGGTWTVVGSAGFSSGQADYTSLAFAPDGTPYVAFEDYANGYRASVMKYDGLNWTAVGSAGFSAGQAGFTSLAFAPDGNPYVVYQDSASSGKTTMMRYSGGFWSTVGNAGFSAGQAGFTTLAFASDGTPYVAYRDYYNGYWASVMKYSDGAWSVVGSAGFSFGQAAFTSIAFAPDGTPYVAYQDYSYGNKAMVMKYSGGAWSVVGNAGFSAGQADYTFLAFAPDGTPYIAFQDLANNYKATVMRYSAATSITSINRQVPAEQVTNAALATFRVTFSDPVDGVTAGNFDLSPMLSGAVITGVVPVGSAPTRQWDVTVATGSADGPLGLRLTVRGSISLGIATPLPYAGQTFVIDKTGPVISIGAPTSSWVMSDAVDYVVTYNDPSFSASTLTAGDVTLNKTGTANGTITVSGSGNSRIVTVSNFSGSGTLEISLAAGTATDLLGNSALATGPSTTFSVPLQAGPTLAAPTITNLAAGSATLILQSGATGIGYFTVLPGSNATCGNGFQTRSGRDSLGGNAYRFGSLPLTANTPSYYTVRNLAASTSYTVCFTADAGAMLLQSTPASVNLTTTVVSSPANPAWNPAGSTGFSVGQAYSQSLAIAPDGTPFVAYQDVANGYRATVMKYSGGSWTAVGNAGFSAGQANYLSLAFAPDGTAYVAFQDYNNYNNATVMKYSGGVWSVVGSAGFSAGMAYFTSLAFAPDGTPYVAFEDYGNNSKATVMKYSGGTWSTVGNAGFSASYTTYNSLAFAPDGTPYVAYRDYANSNKATVMKYSGGAWIAVGSTGFSSGMADYLSLAIAPDGTPYVGYTDSTNGRRAMVMSFNGVAWSTVGSASLIATATYYLSLAIDPDGAPYVAYRDGYKSYKVTMMKYSGGAWATVGSAGLSAGESCYISMAIAPDGTPYVAFEDFANNYKATVLRYSAATAITAINRQAPAEQVTNAASATFRVTFSDPVDGVTSGNFDLSPMLSGAAIAGVVPLGSSPAQQWDVTVATGSVDGSLGLRLVNSGGISLGITTPLPYAGQTYVIDKTGPVISIGAPTSSWVMADAVDYVVTYNDPSFLASTLTAGDVTLNQTGTANGTVTVSSSGNSRIVTVSNLSGSGTMGISLAAGTAIDLLGNSALAAGPSTTFSVPLQAGPILVAPTITNLAAGSATLILQSGVTGTGYFTVLPGNNAICGNGFQTRSGRDSLSESAYRFGSLSLTANTPGYYTVRNLNASASYTVCFTADDGALLLSLPTNTNLTTTAIVSLANPTWSQVGLVGFSAGRADYTSLAFAPDGTPYVAFEDYGNFTKATVMKYSAGTWSAVGNAGFSGPYADYISLAFAPDGTPYVANMDSNNSYKATVRKYSGGVWSLVGGGGFSAGQAEYESLAIAPDGTPYVAFYDNLNSGKATVMKYSGGAWSAVGNTGFSADRAFYLSLAFAPDGTPYVAFQDFANSGRTKVMMYSGGAWTSVGSVLPGSAAFTSLVFAPDGTPYVAFQQDYVNGYRATVMKYSGGAWTTVGSAGFSAGQAGFPSLAFAPDGTPYVAYVDSYYSGKVTVKKYISGSWATVSSDGFSAGPAEYISLAFAPDGTPYVAYKDIANSKKATVMKLTEAVLTMPSVSNASITSLSDTSATLNATVNDNGAATSVTFDYGLVTGYGTSTSGGVIAAGAGSTTVSTNIASLTCGSNYRFRVVASNSAGATFSSDQMFSTAACVFTPTLTVRLAGTGGGSITSDLPGIHFINGRSGSGINATLPVSTMITLYATPATDSLFIGWSGGGCSGTGSCSVTLNANTSVNATFNLNEQIMLNQTQAKFALLQQAYNAISGEDTLLLRAYTFIENLNFNRNVIVTLAGGLDSSYTSTIGATMVTGSLTISQGIVTVSNLVIQ